MNDAVKELAASGARFIVIGGHAIRYAGFPGVKLKRLAGRHLLAAKEKANRPIDQPDLYFLKKLESMGKLI